MVLLEEHDRANGGDITLLTRTAVDNLRIRLGTAAFGRQVLQWGLDVAAGLEHLHMNEMLHLNFRVSNTIVCGGIAKVTRWVLLRGKAPKTPQAATSMVLAPFSTSFWAGGCRATGVLVLPFPSTNLKPLT